MLEPPLILVCDHRGEGLAEGLRPLAAVGFRVETSANLARTREDIERLRPQVLLVDTLVRGGRIELEAIDRARDGTPLPVLLVAEPSDPLPAVSASRALSGPWDLVYRDAPLEEYLMRIERLRGQAQGLRELAEVRHLATHDERTGLLRAGPFEERLREHFSAAHRHRFDLALLVLDLDHFGEVNKRWDHTVGDRVISRMGQTVRRALRAEDLGGRLGGDEFGVVLPYTPRLDAARVVTRLRDEVRATEERLESGETIRFTASIGFETFNGSDLASVEELRRHAEIALRHAKATGGDRAVYFASVPPASSPGARTHEDRP